MRYARCVTLSPRLHRYTFREYLELEETSSVRHEFLEGEIYAMAGGTPEHAALAMSLGAALVAATRGGSCRVHSSDLRVRALATGLATYPDVTVVCGPYQRDPESSTTITNPRVVIEITSDSTEDYDRGEKLESYKRIPALAAIVLVSHREHLIEVIERQDDGGWRRSEARRGARVNLDAIGCELDVDEIYSSALGPASD
jgi:Uma2 family endonuclease